MQLRCGIALICMLLVTLPACDAFSPCPPDPGAVDSRDFAGIGDDTLIFTGHVIRYVPAPVLDARGYDIGVGRWLKGRPDIDAFLRLAQPVPGIEPGEPVMVIAEPGPRSPIILPGPCAPLVPISEDDVGGDA